MSTALAPAESNEALPPLDREARLVALRSEMDGAGCGALVVSKPANIRWLTGFSGSNGLVLVLPDRLVVITDGRYQTQLERELKAAAVAAEQVIERDPSATVGQVLKGCQTVALEADHLSWSRARELTDWVAPAATLPTKAMVEECRRVKEPGEIARLSQAAAIADSALSQVAPRLQPNGNEGLSELAFARALEAAMFDLGADALSFPTIVASGPNSALPHAKPSERKIGPGDTVVVDFGASVDGYGSDMTRTFLIDPVPAVAHELYDAVEAAQRAGVASVADGVTEKSVDQACRQILADHGLAEAFIHGTGHGIGLEIHEQPMLSTRSTGILRSNQVVTVEPGAYVAGVGGVRIEDSVVVTDQGCRAITLAPKRKDVPRPKR